MWQKKLSDYTLFKNRFEACDAELKIKPIITSPLMSGEVTMSGEIAPIISGEAQRRVSLYKFNIEVTTPGKISIDKVNFDTAGGPDGSIELSNLQLIELNGPTPLYNCTLENNSQQIVCIPHQTTAKFVVESRTAVYELSAMARIISPGSRKIYNVSKDGLIYNE